MKVLALAVALILAACSGSVPTATNSPGTPSPDVSTSSATDTLPPASTTPTPIAEDPSWPPQPDRDFRYLSIEQLTLSKDGRRIKLDFVGARAYSPDDPCSADYAATVAVVEGVLEVGVEESSRPSPTEGIECDAMGHARSLEVNLDRALHRLGLARSERIRALPGPSRTGSSNLRVCPTAGSCEPSAMSRRARRVVGSGPTRPIPRLPTRPGASSCTSPSTVR